jgi:hypothetical protein
VLNRANEKARIFHDDADYHLFLSLIAEAHARIPLALFAVCLMPNHCVRSSARVVMTTSHAGRIGYSAAMWAAIADGMQPPPVSGRADTRHSQFSRIDIS